MSKRSDALAIVPTYRQAVPDLDYVGPTEMSLCDWCEWADSHCNHPRSQRDRHLYLSTNLKHPEGEFWEMVIQGECPGYRPSLWTRVLRRLGLRRPVMR